MGISYDESISNFAFSNYLQMNKTILSAVILLASSFPLRSQIMNNPNTNQSLAPVESLTLTDEWDKVFPISEKVDHKKLTFVNRYGITLVADIYTPKGAQE